jgi:diguanylate cyclase (GGDEF)-like protein
MRCLSVQYVGGRPSELWEFTVRDSVIKRVLVCPSLPSLPGVAVEVLELSRDPDVPMKRIAKAVEHDQALAAKILKTVNSSYYGLSQPCSTISRAMGYLGLSTVKSLVLGFSLVDCFKGEADDSFDYEGHWQRALYSAAGARLIAQRGNARCDPDEAFIGGLMQDVGQLAMLLALGDEYMRVVVGLQKSHELIGEAEREQLGVDHGEVGAQLTEKWRLPAGMIAVVRHHHSESKAPPEHLEMVRVVVLSRMISVMLHGSAGASAVREVRETAREWFGFDEKTLGVVIEELALGAAELGKLFQVPTGEAPDIASLMGEAQDKLVEHQQGMQRQADELTKQAMTDGLTGVANRKRFDELVRAGWGATVEGGSALSVIFCDADRFKLVNDTHGHQSGDEVLIRLAEVLREVVGDRGTVCRYGGEEFAVAMSGVTRDDAARVAEEIRRQVEDTTIDVSGLECGTEELRITLSLGVSGVNNRAEAEEVGGVARLVKLADEGVYAAKEGGRNKVCVRVPGTKENGSAAEQTGNVLMRVLLVEDDALHAKLVELPLKGVRGVDFRVAESGERAIEILGEKGYRPDLILSDLGLPGIGGTEMISAIRRDESLVRVPIVVLTSNDDAGIALDCMQAGANAFIPKSRLGDDPRRRVLQITQFWSIARAA